MSEMTLSTRKKTASSMNHLLNKNEISFQWKCVENVK